MCVLEIHPLIKTSKYFFNFFFHLSFLA